MLNKTLQKLTTMACLLFPAAAASADTSYPDFAAMNIDARILVIREEMHLRLQAAEQDAPVRAVCIAELFAPQGDGQLSHRHGCGGVRCRSIRDGRRRTNG